MNQATKSNAGASGWSRGLVLGLASFAAGAALGAWWSVQSPLRSPAATDETGPPALSASTESVLQHLSAPIEIRFYSLLDPASVDDQSRDFATRVDRLLARYEQEAGSKIKVERVKLISPKSANAAVADGIQAFNMDRGEACYLGLVAVCNGQKFALASLDPAWEPALESDISRVIAVASYSAPPSAAARKADVASIEAVKQSIPNFESVSVEDGSRQLRVAELAQYKKSAQEMQARVSQAEERFLEAQKGPSRSDQDAALKALQEVQKEQAAKLQEIALESKAQLEALQQLKGTAR